MGLRYRIPFKDSDNNAYEVLVYRADYTGEAKELTGAPSCFVVSGTDEDFMYTPVRGTTATINVVDSELLLDLYSINNQYAAVKLIKNGVLEWTGYIKPEQFTQPYVNVATSVGVECVGALATLEHIEYKTQTVTGYITMMDLMRYMIASANGGYRGVYIPNVYGRTSAMAGNVLDDILLCEENFTSEEMNLMEVMEAVCKFLNWTIYEHGGYLWFVDADWHGEYHLYLEDFMIFVIVEGNEVLVQNVGYNGSDANTLDVVHGYNKASVKSVNNVFDDVVKDEPYDILKTIGGSYYVRTYTSDDEAHGVRKLFLRPMFWTLYQYKDANTPALEQEEVYGMESYDLNKLLGGLLMKEADYKCVATNDPTPVEGVTDFSYMNSIQIRVAKTRSAEPDISWEREAVVMRGENAVYSDCAISIDGTVDGFFDDDMLEPGKNFLLRLIKVAVECGGKYYNGSSWVNNYTTFTIEVDENGAIKSNKTPLTPYRGLSGYIIPMDFFVGAPTVTIFCPMWLDVEGLFITGTKIRNLKFGYAKKEGVVEEGKDGDRVYENVVNEAYMSEADEIEFEIGSYNEDGATYSKALLGDDFLTDNLYCAIVGKYVRPEELMIRRIVNRYGATKIKLTEALRMTGEITPLTAVSDRTMVGKRFRMTSGEWDYEQNRLTLQMQEDVV